MSVKSLITEFATQAFERVRQHAGNNGEIRQHVGIARGRENRATGRRKEENGNTAVENASTVSELLTSTVGSVITDLSAIGVKPT